MKKIQKIVVGVLIIALIVGGVALFADYNKRKAVGNDSDNVTNNSEETSNIDVKETRTKIEELPQDYSFIQAIKDGCVYSSNGTKVYNKDELDSFLENVNNNIPDSIRWK
jgi:hypothetical protein